VSSDTGVGSGVGSGVGLEVLAGGAALADGLAVGLDVGFCVGLAVTGTFSSSPIIERIQAMCELTRVYTPYILACAHPSP